MNYDRSIFSKELGKYSGIEMDNSQNNDGSYPYDQMSNTTGNLNKRLQYSKNDNNFSTWYQESTSPDSGAFKIVTCKLDYARTLSEDDHCSLLAGFVETTDGPQMMVGMASINFQNDEDDNVVSGAITGDDIPGQIYTVLNDLISDKDFSSSSDGRKSIPDIIKANFQAMEKAIS